VPVAELGERRVYYEEHGEGDPLLLIQGLGQGLWAWRYVGDGLSRRFRTIVFDNRGTGRSPASEESYGIGDLAEDAAQGLRGRIHRWAKAHNDFYLRYSPGPLYDLALSMLVRGLPRRGFRRRQFTPLRSLRR